MSRENDLFDNARQRLDRDETTVAVESISVENYAHALELLYNRIDYERIGHAPYTSNHYRLDRMRQLLSLLGSPQDDYPIIHVAGTKGKGTTAALVCNALRACGLRTGLFTSPHLLRLEERIQFQGEPCSEQQLVALTNTVLNAAIVLEARGAGRPTFFELTTAMGFLHASQQSADCLVLEVGLGGRLDSTNVCKPAICIITSISLDHQAQLGNTIPEIAGEKAGIIKPDVPVICTARDQQARQVIAAVANKTGSTLHLIDRDFLVSWRAISTPASTNERVNSQNLAESESAPGKVPVVSLERPVVLASTKNSPNAVIGFKWSKDASLAQSNPLLSNQTHWSTQLLGQHQAENIAGALATLDVLTGLGWKLPKERIEEAIATCCPPARLQVVSREPVGIIDTAHNPASIEAAINAIDEHFSNIPRIIIFASSRDKDYRRMLELLLPSCHHLILTAYQNNPRALPVAELQNVVKELQGHGLAPALNHAGTTQPNVVHQAATPAAAWVLAQSLSDGTHLILATGSFFLAAELLPVVGKSLGHSWQE